MAWLPHPHIRLGLGRVLPLPPPRGGRGARGAIGTHPPAGMPKYLPPPAWSVGARRGRASPKSISLAYPSCW